MPHTNQLQYVDDDESERMDAEFEEAAHTGGWKVAYADLTTALMALFIVLWILGSSDDVKRSVQRYFRDPSVTSFSPSTPDPATVENEASVLDGSDSVLEGAGESSDDAIVELWIDRAKGIQQALSELPSFSKYNEQIELALTPEGLRISLIEFQDSPLFQIGRYDLNPEAEELLEAIAAEIKPLGTHVIIEGHTDSRPYVSQATMTNWELSTGRAQTARRVLERIGVSRSQIEEVRGFADRQLYNAEDPHDSRNRRISITLLSDLALELLQKKNTVRILN